MKYLVIELFSQTASFRNPEFQNFHKTLLLPPPTTVFGIAGAAMGLGPKATQDFFDEGNWSLGVYGNALGKGKDLWKYRTLNPQKPTSIIHREILFQNHFVFVFGGDDTEKLNRLYEAFLSPVYALTVGNSDSLAKIINVDWITDLVTSRTVANCLVEGDIVSAVMDKALEDPVFSIYATSDPIAYDLPTQFTYKKEYGMRSVSARKTLSMISEAMELNLDITGVRYKEIFIPTFLIH